MKTIGTAGQSGLGVNFLGGPRGIAVDANSNLYIADRDNHRIQVFNTTYDYVFTIGVNGTSGMDNEHLNKPYGVGVDSSGYIYVADSNNHRIQIFYPNGTYYMTLGTVKGTNSTSFNFPAAVSITDT
ncbi:MAG: NHL repeat-containing protein, partial [Thermoplasmata archaeon]